MIGLVRSITKEGVNMLTKFKNTLQIVVIIALVVQLGGCIFVDRDRHGHPWHHEHDSEPSVDIRVHG